jgi:hypothetical protein
MSTNVKAEDRGRNGGDVATSEHAHDENLEYGPTPAGAKYEHTDIDPAVGYKFASWLAVAMLISAAIVYGAFRFFEGQQQTANAAAQKFPLAVGQAKQPPAPSLQTQPFQDIFTLRQAESARLGGYGWVDKEGGVARIPIDRAMELTAQRGLPVRAGATKEPNVVSQDSSSGRTAAAR